MSAPVVVLAAGGTGGHLFPAESLASALNLQNVRTILITDDRVDRLSGAFPAEQVIQVPSASPSGGSVFRKAKAGIKLAFGTLSAFSILRRLKPDAVVGFGGYPTVPPLLAASFLRIPTVVHEQNAVMGRANRLLAPRSTLIATGFPKVRNIPNGIKADIVHTGNPVRPAVLKAAEIPFAPLRVDGVLKLLVFGGSQGARVMSDVVPEALKLIPHDLRSRLDITQQARAEDCDRVKHVYAALGIRHDVQPFFKDLPERMAFAHFVIARSGASTIAELTALGRPALLVPLPGALDQDQAANAQFLVDAGAAKMVIQKNFTPEQLAEEILQYFAKPEELTAIATKAKEIAILDAGERLATAILHHLSMHRHGSK